MMILNHTELQALEGLDPFYWVLYIGGLRPKMDYATGLVGNLPKKNLISYQLLRERLFIEPRQGIKTPRYPSRFAIMRGINFLLKRGIIAKIAHPKKLILKCILAATDASIQTEAARTPLPKNASKTRKSATSKILKQPMIADTNRMILTEAAPKLQLATSEVDENSATPPCIRIVNTNVLTKAEVEASFNRFWAAHPIKKRKRECLAIYSKKKLYLIEDKILNYLATAKTQDRQWLAGYIPHPKTILNQELWHDDIEEQPNGNAGYHHITTEIFRHTYEPQVIDY